MKLSGFIQLLGALPLAIASNCTASGHSSREINAYQDMNRNRTLSVGYVRYPALLTWKSAALIHAYNAITGPLSRLPAS